jgi:hypothetical protein
MASTTASVGKGLAIHDASDTAKRRLAIGGQFESDLAFAHRQNQRAAVAGNDGLHLGLRNRRKCLVADDLVTPHRIFVSAGRNN